MPRHLAPQEKPSEEVPQAVPGVEEQSTSSTSGSTTSKSSSTSGSESRAPTVIGEAPGAATGDATSAAPGEALMVTGDPRLDDDDEAALSASRDETIGKMVIDSGATESLGSLEALEYLSDRLSGNSRITVNPCIQQRFRFGNGTRGAASSMVTLDHVMGGHPVTIGINCLETKRYVPILASIKFLRALGAKVCFETDRLFTRFGDVRLERTSSGHLVLDLLKQDLLEEPRAQRGGQL